MSSKNSIPSDWKRVYEGAISDCEYSVRLDRIAEARHAIFDRAEEILTQPSSQERRALRQALRTLQLLEEAAISRSQGRVGDAP
jgi:hypothetical protein